MATVTFGAGVAGRVARPGRSDPRGRVNGYPGSGEHDAALRAIATVTRVARLEAGAAGAWRGRGAAWRARRGRGGELPPEGDSPAPRYVVPPMVTARSSRDSSWCDMDVGPPASPTVSLAACSRPDPLEHASVGVSVAPESKAVSVLGPHAGSADRQTASVFARTRGPALFWRLAFGNAAVLAAACIITALVFAPSVEDVALRELAIFSGGLVLMLALNLLLLRHALAPLRELTQFARRIDPLEPGHRLEIGGGDSEAAELAAAFNEMLERLEAERRDSVRRALAAQEGERLRVAQELHDGVGQSLTGVVLQLGRVARDVDTASLEGVMEAQETARGSLEEVRRIARMLRPEALDDLGLPSALRVLGERVGEHSELDVGVHVCRACRTSAATPSSCSTASPRRRSPTSPATRGPSVRRCGSSWSADARPWRSTTTAPGCPAAPTRAAASAACASARC